MTKLNKFTSNHAGMYYITENILMLTSTCKNWNVTTILANNPYSKFHGANMGPIWGQQDPGGPHDGPMNFVIWECMITSIQMKQPWRIWQAKETVWLYYSLYNQTQTTQRKDMHILYVNMQTILDSHR